ncbi:MAG: NADH-quinone oxidoreductase subunit K, partial [Microlunatus sp.]|nr:NADH-quinone oxidoreductase subunit K [Microlunatus sp.]
CATDKGRDISDPLPHAMGLTAIVITLGLTAFLLTMAYRSFQLNGNDEVQDDLEDRKIVRLAQADLASGSYDEDDHSLPSEDGTDPDPAEEGSAEEDSQVQDPGERQSRGTQIDGSSAATDERRDVAEEATDEIIGSGGWGTGS